ncbi:unnamed protein product [Arabidopsis halleri]
MRSKRSLDRGAGRRKRREVEHQQEGEAETHQGDSSSAWHESQAGIDDHLRSYFN